MNQETSTIQQISQQNSSNNFFSYVLRKSICISDIRSNIMDELSDVCEEEDEEEDIPAPRKKSIQKKRKRTV